MPRHFFHIEDHPSSPDDEGTELPDRHAARCEALRFAGELMRDSVPEDVMHQEPLRVRVTDEDGEDVVVLEIQDVKGRSGREPSQQQASRQSAH